MSLTVREVADRFGVSTALIQSRVMAGATVVVGRQGRHLLLSDHAPADLLNHVELLKDAKNERKQAQAWERAWERGWQYERLIRHNAQLRAERGDTPGKRLPPDEWNVLRAAVFARDGNVCKYCARPLEPWDLVCDHIYPISRGGSNTLDNLATACWSCNSRKGDRTPEEWFHDIGVTRPLIAGL